MTHHPSKFSGKKKSDYSCYKYKLKQIKHYIIHMICELKNIVPTGLWLVSVVERFYQNAAPTGLINS